MSAVSRASRALRIGAILLTAGVVASGLVASSIIISSVLEARPLVPAEERDQPYSGIVRACEDPAATGYIQGAFAARESEYWHSGLEILAFDEVKEVGFRSNGLDYIPRRYCVARAILNNQKVRTVSYAIEEAGGSIGFTDNVVWCVDGLDRNNAFAPACKMARP